MHTLRIGVAADEVASVGLGGRSRVLVAEEDGGGLAERLVVAGHAVTVCRVGDAAATAEIVRPHLMLVEACPAGWAAGRRVKEREWGRRVRILAVGGWEQARRRAEAVAAGCDGCLLRPVGTEVIDCLLADADAAC